MTVDAFPDLEVLVPALIEAAGLGRAATSTPGSWDGNLPFHRVTVYGGADDGVTDVSRFDVDTFAADRVSARDAAEAVRQLLTRRGAHVLTNGVIDTITTDTRPHQVPWTTEPSPVRYTAAYSGSARR